MEAGKKRLSGDTVREATSDEVKENRVTGKPGQRTINANIRNNCSLTRVLRACVFGLD